MSKTFNITWAAPASQGSSNITDHDVSYTPANGTETIVATGSALSSYTLAGLTDDETYTVKVRAKNAIGNGAWSDAVTRIAAVGGTDPNFSSVSMLCAFDGSGTTYTDDGPNGVTIANSAYNGGGDSQSTAQAKFGAGSLLVNSSNAAAVGAAGAAPTGTQDFTLEMWIYSTASSVYSRTLLATSGVEVAPLFVLTDRGLQVDSSYATSFSAPSNSQWHHYALVRESNTFRVYRDGVQMTTLASSTSLGQQVSPTLFIGGQPYYGTNGFLGGYIDEVRATLGVARYTGGTTFTPPVAAFPRS